MKKTLFSLAFLSITYCANAQVGIGTTTPQSTLTVEGSLETAYKEVTTGTTLTATDYYVAYNGTTDGTITMPTVGTGTTSFTGRTYKIKNVSNNLVTIAGNGNTLRNFDTPTATIVLKKGQYAEIVNNANTSGATWDVSFINDGAPAPDKWEFDNIYDYTALAFQDATASGIDLTGFTQSITVPANKEAKIVVTYSIPVGTNANTLSFSGANTHNPPTSYNPPTTVSQVQANLLASTVSLTGGYYGVTLSRAYSPSATASTSFTEFPSGSRKSTVVPRSGNQYSMTTITATVADVISKSASVQTVSYKLSSYLESLANATYLMYEGKGTGADAGKNFNWGKGYWSIQVFLK